MADLDLVGWLIDGGAELYSWLAVSHLETLGYAHADSSAVQRFVIDSRSRPFAAGHRFDVWESASFGRVVWFSLDSEIPHMSSIVACICIPLAGTGLPLYVMNLNLKIKAGTFNTIAGYRGEPSELAAFRALFSGLLGQPPAALAKENPPTFAGVRLMFWLDEPPIDWSLGLARVCLGHWFARLATAQPGSGARQLACNASFVGEMVDLHSREGGGVYDAVFGSGWLAALFRDRVFG